MKKPDEGHKNLIVSSFGCKPYLPLASSPISSFSAENDLNK